MPGTMKPSPWNDWIALIETGDRDPSAVLVALDDERVVGLCTIQHSASSTFARVGFLGVARDVRGRGVATLLKAHQSAWCCRNGVSTLETVNHDANTAMQVINERAGFRHRPAQLVLVGAPTPPDDEPTGTVARA